MSASADRTMFLRRSLRLDAAASGVCGVILVVGAGPIARLFGFAPPALAFAVGAGLLVFAAALLWNAGRPRVSRTEAIVTVVLNAAWVLGSLVLIADGPLTLLGNLAVAAVAAAVALFAVLETVGLRRLREA